MSTQKALVLTEKKSPWKIAENTIPTPGPKDVLVKIISTALNPVDWKIQVHGWLSEDFPFIAGTDGAGIVEAVGAEVTTLTKGDRVFFQGFFDRQHATFQQYCIVPAEITAKIPSNISFDQAASVPLGFATVFIALWNHDPKAQSLSFPAPWEEGGLTMFASKPAFIIGGASSVGQYAIQAAKLSKFSPIIATASLHNEPLLKSLGATHVLDRSLSSDAILAELKKITGGAPIELVYDAVSLEDTEALAYDALAPGGSLVLVLPDVIPAEKKKAGDNKKVIQVMGNVQMPENRQIGIEVYSRLTEWLEKGIIVPNRTEVLPDGLAGIPDGLKRMEQNKVSGVKLIVHPQETP